MYEVASIRSGIGENNEKSNLYKGKSMNDSRFVNKNLRLVGVDSNIISSMICRAKTKGKECRFAKVDISEV